MPALSRTARHVGLVAGLLLTFFVMLSFQVNRARALSSARGAVFGLVSPLQRLVSMTTLNLSSLWSGYIGLVGASAENDELRAENSRLQQRVRQLEETRRENSRLHAMLGIEAAPETTTRVARVIGRDISHRFQSVTLNRGSADGITMDAPVLSPDGALVGRVVALARWTSLVQLITDPLSGIGARLAESRRTGLLNGVDGPELELLYIDSMTEVISGEAVVTSGEDSLYPPGILVGTVSSFNVGPPVPGTPTVPLARDETALFLEVSVHPGVDVLRLENVVVLSPRRSS